ncbi:hypothetical protein HZC30_03890, partial [Candidatus Woesearchaeota archaeon]|nr:hypothetical protein [Candidatus Woesearchaeota archaeon]
TEQNFTWGVLAINTYKSIYLPGETAQIAIGVLDNKGNVVCNATIVLEITAPSGSKEVLSTANGKIIVSPLCPEYIPTAEPDYSTTYAVSELGTYGMNLTAVTYDGISNIDDSFLSQSYVEFDVARSGPTRIFPQIAYLMNFTVLANQNYSGTVEETVPGDFIITPQEGMSTTVNENNLTLTWNKSLVAGQNYTWGYEFDAPDLSPYLYLLGPLQIGTFSEAREWMMVGDSINNGTVTFVGPTLNSGKWTTNTTIVTNVSISNTTGLSSVVWVWNNASYSLYDNSLVLMLNLNKVAALGENSTITVDHSKYSNNGTIYGSAGWDPLGKYNGAYNFDGIDDYIGFGDAPSLKPPMFTLQTWVKVNSWTQKRGLLHLLKETGINCQGYDLGVSNDNNYYFYVDDGNGCAFITAPGQGGWHLLTGTFDGTTMRLYVDGVEKSSGASAVSYSSKHSLCIGKWCDGNNNYFFNGTIDEVRIYNRSLSSTEIGQLYMSNLYKYDVDKWGLYVNQSKNATSGLDLGIYNYQTLAVDSQGNSGSTEIRNVIVSLVLAEENDGLGREPDKIYLYNETALQQVSNFTWSRSGKGKIKWLNTLNLTGPNIRNDRSLDNKIEVGEGWVSVDSVNAPILSTPAQITFGNTDCSRCTPNTIISAWGVPGSKEEIYATGQSCTLSGKCSDVQCNANTCTFQVSGFTGYASGGNANLTINDSAEGTTAFTNTVVNYYAYYVNATSGALITGASCNVTDDGGTYVMSENTNFYNYTKSTGYSQPGTKNWNVTCAASGFTTLTANDTISIVQGCGTINNGLTLTSNVNSAGTCFTINASNIVLDCAGYWVNFSTSGVGKGVDNSGGFDNVTIKNCNFWYNNNAAEVLLFNNSADNATIYNNTINGTGSSPMTGVSFPVAAANANITGNTITIIPNNGRGVSLTAPTNAYVQENIIDSSGGGAHGVEISGATLANQVVLNNITLRNAVSGTWTNGVFLTGSSVTTVSTNKITIIGNNTRGVMLANSNSSVVTHNTINLSASPAGYFSKGISLTSSSYNNNVSNTTLYLERDNAKGIESSGTTTNSIEQSTITGSGASGVGIELSSTNSTNLTSNTITLTGANTNGVSISSDSTNNRLVNNGLSSSNGIEIGDGGGTHTNYLIYNNNLGKIAWINSSAGGFLTNLTLDTPIALGTNLFIGNNTIALNTSAFAGQMINSSANITLYGLPFSAISAIRRVEGYSTNSEDVLQEGTNCLGTTCINLSYSGGTLLFNTTSFSSFSATNNTFPTAPALLLIANGNTTTNRTPTFVWNNSVDGDGDPVTYNFILDDNPTFNNPEISITGITNTTGTNTTYTAETELAVDTIYYWKVRGNDSTGYGEHSSAFNFTLQSYLAISLLRNTIDFGNVNNSQQVNTSTGNPLPFWAENVGNIISNVTITATPYFTSVAYPSNNYQFRIEANETGAFNTTTSTMSWSNMSNTSATPHVIGLDWHSWKNDFLTGLSVFVPADEGAGAKTSTVTFTIE